MHERLSVAELVTHLTTKPRWTYLPSKTNMICRITPLPVTLSHIEDHRTIFKLWYV